MGPFQNKYVGAILRGQLMMALNLSTSFLRDLQRQRPQSDEQGHVFSGGLDGAQHVLIENGVICCHAMGTGGHTRHASGGCQAYI